jgi:MinD-like ATPase involved in chromosome partitioning or flagellar assembly
VSLVAVAAAKAAPGVTTSALAMAAAWPAGRQVLLVEADPGGGDLAARFGLAAEPGLVSLAAAARRQIDSALVGDHAQKLPGGLGVLVGPPGPEQAAAALGMLAPAALAGLDGLDAVDIIADLGRLDPRSAALGLARAASLLLVVVRPRLDELQHLSHRVAALRGECRVLGVVLVGTGHYPAEEIATALGVEVLAWLPADPRGASLLGGTGASVGALRRTPLLRAARSMAEAVAGRLADSAAAPAPGSASAAPAGFPTAPPPRSEPAREAQP